MKNYICINDRKSELTPEQLKELGLTMCEGRIGTNKASEYMQGMIDKDRMCDRETCTTCPLNYRSTDAGMYCSDFCIQHPDQAESILRKWAAEHPVKRNPTWREQQKQDMPGATRMLVLCNFGPCMKSECNFPDCYNDPISDEYMKKLRIYVNKQHIDQIEE